MIFQGQKKSHQSIYNKYRLFRGLGLTFALLLFASTTSHAAESTHTVGIGVGEVLLMGDFSKNVDNALGLNLIYHFGASQLFGLTTLAHISSHSGGNGQNSLAIKGLSPNVRVNLGYYDRIVVYTLGGFGFFLVDEKIGVQSGSVTTFGLNLGGGVDLLLHPHFKFGTALTFHNIFGKTDPASAIGSSAALSIGGTYVGLFLAMGYIF